MIDQYVKKLVDNLPTSEKQGQAKKHPERLDVVLNGGAFNGSYLAGALSFLKEMERRSYVKIERISGCSVGAIAGLLYWIDGLDLVPKLYESVKTHFKNHFNLEIMKTLRAQLEEQGRLPEDVCERVNGKLFVCYYDIKHNKKVVRSTYKDTADVMETIIRSCYVPFLIDYQVVYKNRFMDGINTHVFLHEKGKKILHLELLSLDKITRCFTVRNEKNNFQRILEGLLDIHNFYVKQSSTSMCSFVEDWTWNQQAYYSLKLMMERIVVYIIRWIQYLQKYVPVNCGENILVQISSRICFDIFSVVIERFCF